MLTDPDVAPAPVATLGGADPDLVSEAARPAGRATWRRRSTSPACWAPAYPARRRPHSGSPGRARGRRRGRPHRRARRGAHLDALAILAEVEVEVEVDAANEVFGVYAAERGGLDHVRAARVGAAIIGRAPRGFAASLRERALPTAT